MRSVTLLGTWYRFSATCVVFTHKPWPGLATAQPDLLSPHMPLITWVTTPVCSRKSAISGVPPFCTEMLMYLFFRRNSVSQQDKMLKKLFPSTLSSDIDLNCSTPVEFSSLRIHTPSTYFHCLATTPLLNILCRTFQGSWCSSGQHL